MINYEVQCWRAGQFKKGKMSDDNSGAVLRRGSDAQVHQQKSADICQKSRAVSQSAAASQKSGGIRSEEGKELGGGEQV